MLCVKIYRWMVPTSVLVSDTVCLTKQIEQLGGKVNIRGMVHKVCFAHCKYNTYQTKGVKVCNSDGHIRILFNSFRERWRIERGRFEVFNLN